MKIKRSGLSQQKRRKIKQSGNAAGSFIFRRDRILIKNITRKRVPTSQLEKHNFPTLQDIERDYIEIVLSHVGNNRTMAAEILGIDRVSLWRKMKRLENSTCTAPR